jgi:hypothetical protein
MVVRSHHGEACLGSNGLAGHIDDLGTRDVMQNVAARIVLVEIVIVSHRFLWVSIGKLL